MATDLEVTRTGPSTLALRVEGGWLNSPASSLLRSPRLTFEAGERIERPAGGPVVTVDEVTPDGRPLLLAIDFGVPLEDPDLSWLAWVDGELAPFPLPAVGETVPLPPTVPAFR